MGFGRGPGRGAKAGVHEVLPAEGTAQSQEPWDHRGGRADVNCVMAEDWTWGRQRVQGVSWASVSWAPHNSITVSLAATTVSGPIGSGAVQQLERRLIRPRSPLGPPPSFGEHVSWLPAHTLWVLPL